jgi:hypothetical protein
MPEVLKQRTPKLAPVPETEAAAEPTLPRNPLDPSLARQMSDIGSAGLTPSSALDLVMRLIAEVPVTSKEAMDQIKMLDKLINTARAMMETKLKSEEAAAISARIDDLETRIDDLMALRPGDSVCPAEVWDDVGHD